MLAALSQLLTQQRPLVGFTCYDLETGSAVLAAAERRRAPVVLLVSARSLTSTTGTALVGGLVHLISGASVPGCIELDHLRQIGDRERAALTSGAGAAMVDASMYPFQENIRTTAEAVDAGIPIGVEIEGEIGRLEGNEDLADKDGRTSSFTHTVEAVQFVNATGVTCLAVAVGNRHGHYEQPPVLNFDLLSNLTSAVDVPIALHGCSGLTELDLKMAIDCGVAKMNFNTDLRAAYFSALHKGLAQATPGLDLLGLKEGVAEAVEVATGRILDTVGWVVARPDSAAIGPR
jgi:tagatose 1,6-diphosphate aldolase GatY/KbaY